MAALSGAALGATTGGVVGGLIGLGIPEIEAKIYEEKLNDRPKARETLHRLYTQFSTSTMRDDALWREAELWRKDGDTGTACDRLATLTSDFPDSRYVPCTSLRCPSVKRPAKSKAPATCHEYLLRDKDAAKSSDPAAP